LESKRVEVNRRLKQMCGDGKVRYCKVEFNPWRGGYLGRDDEEAHKKTIIETAVKFIKSLYQNFNFKLQGQVFWLA